MLSIVTWNAWKFAEITSVLDWITYKQNPLDIPEIQTNSLIDISVDKCRQAFESIWWPVLVDDSGVYFDHLNNFPGALTKYFIDGIWVDWIQRLYTGVENKKAKFVSVLSYMDDTLENPIQFIWEVHWVLNFDYVTEENTNPSLPYNLIFQAEWMDVPALFDLDLWKKEYNFRIKATKKFKEWYLSR